MDADADGDGYSQRGDGVLRVNHTGAPPGGGPPELNRLHIGILIIHMDVNKIS